MSQHLIGFCKTLLFQLVLVNRTPTSRPSVYVQHPKILAINLQRSISHDIMPRIYRENFDTKFTYWPKYSMIVQGVKLSRFYLSLTLMHSRKCLPGKVLSYFRRRLEVPNQLLNNTAQTSRRSLNGGSIFF